jgi:hypothetical protein
MDRDGAKDNRIELEGDLPRLDVLDSHLAPSRHLDIRRQQVQGDCPAGDSVRENAGQRQMGARELEQLTPGSNHESADRRRISTE